MSKEWREASDLRSSLLGVGLVIVSALLLRFWRLRGGAVSADEAVVIDAVRQLLHAGSYHPQALIKTIRDCLDA